MTRILIVDDENTIRLSLQKLLPHMGYEVAGTAADGIEAVERARVLRPDIVLMDIVMPGKMDGIDAAKAIRAELGIPVIFLTGYADDVHINRAKCAEPYGYLVKPSSEDELKAAIELALHRKAQETKGYPATSYYPDLTRLSSYFFWVAAGDFSRMLHISPTYEQIFGRSREAFLQNPLDYLEAIHPNDRQGVLLSMETQKAGNITEDYFRIVLSDGSVRWIRNCAYPTWDSGSVSRITGITEDVTDRRQMEDALRESMEKYQIVADFTYDWEFWLGADNRFLYVSPACMRITGYPPEAFLKEPGLLESICHPEDRETLRKHLHIAPDDTKDGKLDFRIITARGEERWIGHRCQAVFGRNGRCMGRRGSNRDITDRIRWEQELHESEEKYRLLVENTNDLICRLRDDGTFLFISGAAFTLFGYTPQEVTGLSGFTLVHPEDRHLLEKTLETATISGMTETVEFRLRCRDGQYKWVEASGKRMPDGQTGDKTITMVVRDATERKLYESKQIVMSKLESTGILAGGIAHDFNNLLAAILGNIELALEQVPAEGEAADHLAIAEKAAWEAQGLTQQLITFAKGGAPVRKRITLPRLIEENTRFTLRGSPVGCSFSIASDLRPVEADEGQIGQCVRNIVLNAREAMPEGGMLTVAAENVTLSSPAKVSLPDGDYVRISMTDQGEGIPEEVILKVFDPYFSTKQRGDTKGMGLGLTICHSILEKHKGAITVETKANAGTTVHIYLPVSQNTPEDREQPLEGKSSRGAGRILIMDDEDMLKNLAGKVLRLAGYEVTLASEGDGAVDLFREAADMGRPFDLVLLDLTIPGGMGGEETLKKMRQLDPGIKAVVMSGYADHPVLIDHELYGFQGALVKPFRLPEMRDLFTRLMKT